MGKNTLSKVLAGIGLAGLVTGVGLPGAIAASGWSATKTGAVSAEEVKKPAPSGWSGNKDSAVSADPKTDEEKKAEEEKVKEGTEAEEVETVPGKSGWSASK